MLEHSVIPLNFGQYDANSVGYIKLKCKNLDRFTFNNGYFHFNRSLALDGDRGIYFNTDEKNENPTGTNLPTTYLNNLITSTTTETQLTYLNTNNLLDNVVPTYNFCENNYLKTIPYEITVTDINFRDTEKNENVYSIKWNRCAQWAPNE